LLFLSKIDDETMASTPRSSRRRRKSGMAGLEEEEVGAALAAMI
jgi:hypothetical protein